MQITVCDACGSGVGVKTRDYPYESYTDAAGSSDTRSKRFDLCTDCKLNALEKWIRDFCKLSGHPIATKMEINEGLIKIVESMVKENESRNRSRM